MTYPLDKKSQTDNSDFSKLLTEVKGIIGDRTGIQFEGKDMLIQSRLLHRIRQLKLHSFQQYLAYLQKNKKSETPELISLLTTHKTEFFRERGHFDYLYHHVFPSLVREGRPIRIWSIGTSTGDEAYSIAITFLEFCKSLKGFETRLPEFQVIGTDIDVNCIDTAREGVYPLKKLSNLQPSIIENYFDVGSGELNQWARVKEKVWKLCEFKVMNILEQSPPLPCFNLVFSRNIFIYFLPEMIQKAMSEVHSHLVDDGLLFLGFSEGFSESILTPNLSFVPLGKSIYKKIIVSETPAPSKNWNKSSKSGSLRFAPIRVLIVDDSPTIRKMIARILSTDPDFEIVGEAAHPIEADKILRSREVDVMTLDIQMPEMDGVTYLRKLAGQKHPAVIMVSSIGFEESSQGMRCFELGAVDYLEKPSSLDMSSKAEEMRTILKGAATSRIQLNRNPNSPPSSKIQYRENPNQKEIIAIGASAGGPNAIHTVLQQFPLNSPPVVIVQHLPKSFTKAFAKKLSENCVIQVVEAENGTPLKQGHAYVAPGGYQMKVEERAGGGLYISLTEEVIPSQHQPSVDFLLSSLAELDKKVRVSAAILTGMGKDGAAGMKNLWMSGAYTVAQDQETCVVFGMPKAAIDAGAIQDVLPLGSIASALFKGLRKN